MPLYKVYARQYVEELGEAEIEAEDLAEVRQKVYDGEVDFDWGDGTDTQDLEVIRIEQITEDEEDE